MALAVKINPLFGSADIAEQIGTGHDADNRVAGKDRSKALVLAGQILLDLENRRIRRYPDELGMHVIGNRRITKSVEQCLFHDPAGDNPDHCLSGHYRHGIDVVARQLATGVGNRTFSRDRLDRRRHDCGNRPQRIHFGEQVRLQLRQHLNDGMILHRCGSG